MAHLTKYKRSQLPHLLKHDSRAKDKNGNYIKFGNEEIDTSRTHLNYNLHQRSDGLSDYEFIKQKGLQYLHKNVVNRSNINWAGSWVITLPQSLAEASDDDKRLFFQTAHDFMAERYGYDNIVGAYVHMDETTPHMHTKIVPLLWDEKKGRYRHSAKDMFDKGDLAFFHQHLSERMEQVFGFDVGIVGDSKDKKKDERLPNKTIAELKAETKKLNEIKSNLLQEAEERQEEVKSLRQEKQRLKEENQLLKKELEGSNFLDSAKKKLALKNVNDIMEKADELTSQRTAELKQANSDIMQNLLAEQKKVKEISQYNANWQKSHAQLKQRVQELENGVGESELAKENENLRSENQELRNEIGRLHGVIKVMQRAFDKVESYLKSFTIGEKKEGMWPRFKSMFRERNSSQYKDFQNIRHDESLYAKSKKQEQER